MIARLCASYFVEMFFCWLAEERQVLCIDWMLSVWLVWLMHTPGCVSVSGGADGGE